MIGKQPAARLGDQLRFPLTLEVLFAQGIILVVAIPVFLARTWWAGDGEATSALAILNWTGVTLFLTMLVEYGFAVIDATVRGSRRIPTFSFAFLTREIGFELADALGNTGNITGLKLVKQQIMVMAFLGLAWFLGTRDWWVLSALVTLFFIFVLPASMAINAMSGSILALLNPVKLARFAWEQGATYLLCILALLGAWAFFVASLQGSLVRFLACLPPGLYCAVLMFKILGDCLHARRDRYFPRVDFQADREALARQSRNREFLDRRLRTILQQVRNRQIDQACRELEHFLVSNDWKYFDAVFAAVSTWPDSRPARHAASGYLTKMLERREYMQALALCEWCLARDDDFTLGDHDALLVLSGQAVTKAQYRAVIRLILNYADRANAPPRSLLEKAAALATAKLNDETRLAEIMARMNGS